VCKVAIGNQTRYLVNTQLTNIIKMKPYTAKVSSGITTSNNLHRFKKDLGSLLESLTPERC